MDENQNQENKLQDYPRETEKNNPFIIPGAIIIAGALVAGAIMYTNSKGGAVAVKGNEFAGTGAAPLVEGDLVDDDAMLGDPSAPVTIVEFADYQCPFCGKFFKTVMPQITEKYIKTGKVKFVYRDFAFLGEESEWAASAAECAKEQGKFWEYHDYLYTHQNGENQGAFHKKNLKQFARVLELDGSKFDSCLDTDKYIEEVRKDSEAGRSLGVSGTPTTFVNGRAVVGAVPFAQFDTLVNNALKK